MGIAYSQARGERQANSDGALTVRLHHGFIAIDAILALVKENGIKPHDVAEIEVGISEWASTYVAQPIEIKMNPRNVVDFQFSLPYTVATALVKGSVFIDDFTDEALKREDVREIMRIVKPRIDPSLFTPDDPRGGMALLVRTKDGRTLEKQVPYIKGNPQNPLTMNDVTEKFSKCLDFAAKPLPKGNADSIIEMVADLENIPNIIEIARMLTP